METQSSRYVMQLAFSNKVREVMERVLRRYAQSLKTTRRFDVRSKVSKEELTLLLERSYLIRANGSEQELLPGLMAFEDFADSFLRDLGKTSADAVLRALKLLYADDQNKGWTEEDIRLICRRELKIFEEEKVQIGMHLVHELRLGNSQFQDNRYTHVFPLEDILDFRSIDKVWNAQVESNRQSPTFRNLALVSGQSKVVTPDLENHGLSTTEAPLDDLLPLNRRKAFDADSSPANITRYAPVALLMVDLDLFKQINDTFGHQVGDKVLIACAEVVQSTVRYKGKAYRYGGEELAVILQNFTPGEAVATAERIREQISRLKVEGCDRQITASIGVAVFPDCAGAEKLVEAADKALYNAKRQGRNRVVAMGDASQPIENHVTSPAVVLRPEDRIAAVDLELRIDQGVRQTFMVTVNNKSDEEVCLKKIKITCRGVVVVEHEPKDEEPIPARKQAALSWTCSFDPHQKIRQLVGIWDRDFETFIDVQLVATVLGSLKICKHSIKVKVEPGSYRIWELP